ncbi:uncharacterized protein LOC144374767 [Ictidomys tridecemlineatus]
MAGRLARRAPPRRPAGRGPPQTGCAGGGAQAPGRDTARGERGRGGLWGGYLSAGRSPHVGGVQELRSMGAARLAAAEGWAVQRDCACALPAHVTRLQPVLLPATARQPADVVGLRRRRRRPEDRGLRALVSAQPARGRAPGCVTLSRHSRDAPGAGPSTPPPWVCGLCAMDNFTDGDFTVVDCALLEDSPYEDDCVFAPEYTTNNYVRVTQLYCDGVDMKYKDYAQSEKYLDICNIWCSKPLSVLQDYCDAIKIYIFWPLLFQHQHSSVIS